MLKIYCTVWVDKFGIQSHCWESGEALGEKLCKSLFLIDPYQGRGSKWRWRGWEESFVMLLSAVSSSEWRRQSMIFFFLHWPYNPWHKFPVSYWTSCIPHHEAVCDYAVNCSVAEGHQKLGVQVVLLQEPGGRVGPREFKNCGLSPHSVCLWWQECGQLCTS